MAGKKIDVKDYGIFTDAVSTANTLGKSAETSKKVMSECKGNLGNESVFMGPICDECVNAFGEVDSKINSIVSNADKVSKTLIQNSSTYKSSDSNNSSKIKSESTTDNKAYSGKMNLDGNVMVIDQPVEKGNKYNLSDDDLAWLANVALHEQGSLEGAKMELSLMANLYEKHKDQYDSIRDYVDYGGWFSEKSQTEEIPSQEYIDAARDVLNEGNLYVPSTIDEHDCFQDIGAISTGDPNNPDDYIPGETIVYNNMGSTYRFQGFAPNGGDPFGSTSDV